MVLRRLINRLEPLGRLGDELAGDDATLLDVERLLQPNGSVNDGGHWSVVYGYSRGRIYLADPSIFQGLRRGIANDRFRARWDRWAMFVNPPA